MTSPINSFADALAYLYEYAGDRAVSAPMPTFGSDFAKIDIHISGHKYHATIPSELARGIWELQEAFNRAVAFALYEVEDIRRLTNGQRNDFELVFAVREGTTGLEAKFDAFIEKLSEGFLTMESKHKAYTMVVIAAILASGWTVTHIVDTQADTKKAEIQANTQVRQEELKTQQFALFEKLAEQGVAAAFAKAAEEGARAIVRRTPDARGVTFGQVKINRSDIEEITRRASMEKSTADIVQEDVWVIGTYAKDTGSTKYILARKDGTEFNVIVNHEEHTSEDLEKIWAAARQRKPIALELNLTLQRGSIRSAQILRVL